MLWYPTHTRCYRYRPWHSIEAAAQKGCAICKILWNATPAKHKESIELPECEGVRCELEWATDTSRFKSLTFSSYSAHGSFQVTCELLFRPGLLLSSTSSFSQ
jgi:hypothetical protein